MVPHHCVADLVDPLLGVVDPQRRPSHGLGSLQAEREQVLKDMDWLAPAVVPQRHGAAGSLHALWRLRQCERQAPTSISRPSRAAVSWSSGTSSSGTRMPCSRRQRGVEEGRCVSCVRARAAFQHTRGARNRPTRSHWLVLRAWCHPRRASGCACSEWPCAPRGGAQQTLRGLRPPAGPRRRPGSGRRPCASCRSARHCNAGVRRAARARETWAACGKRHLSGQRSAARALQRDSCQHTGGIAHGHGYAGSSMVYPSCIQHTARPKLTWCLGAPPL